MPESWPNVIGIAMVSVFVELLVIPPVRVTPLPPSVNAPAPVAKVMLTSDKEQDHCWAIDWWSPRK